MDSDMSGLVTTVRRGRPRGSVRIAEPRAHVTTYLPVSEYQRLLQRANAQDKKLSALIRDILRQNLRRP